MQIGYYKVNDVGGAALGTNFIDKRGSNIQSVNLSNDRIDVDGAFVGGVVKISADYENVSLEIESNDRIAYPLNKVAYDEPRELYVCLRFKVDKYTMQIKEIPIEMTLNEIEKKLGHKVVVVNR